MSYFKFQAKFDDPATTGKGALSQIKDGGEFWATSVEGAFPPEGTVGTVLLFNRAKITDVIGQFNSWYGFVLSDRLKALLTGFRLPTHRYYPATLSHKGRDYPGYWYLHLAWHAEDYIDYTQTKFVVKSILHDDAEPLAISTRQEYEQVRDELRKDNKTYRGIYYLDLRFVPTMELDLFPFFTKPYCSERLAHAISEHEVTGLELTHLPVFTTLEEPPYKRWIRLHGDKHE
jgi:hypothetical protein